MTDNSRKGIAIGGWTAAGLFFAALGVLVPIGWDYYKTKSSLGLALIASNAIVNAEQAPDDLRISYKDADVETLSNLTFRLSNNGRTPIRDGDVVEPPRIAFPEGNRIFDVRTVDLTPNELSVAVGVIFRNGMPTVEIKFPLLNPGDAATFSVLVDSDDPSFSATARIAGISSMTVTRELVVPGLNVSKLPWTVYAAALGTVLVAILSLAALGDLLYEGRVLAALKGGKFRLPRGRPASEYALLVKLMTATKMTPEIKPLTDMLDTAQEAVLPDDQVKTLEDRVDSLVRERAFMRGFTLFFVALTVAGVYYVASSIVSAWQ